MKRILGLDVGDKTLGVAVSDELGWTAQGVTVRQRSSLAADISLPFARGSKAGGHRPRGNRRFFAALFRF